MSESIAVVCSDDTVPTVQDDILASVAQPIPELQRRRGLRLAYEIGQLIVEKFNGGNPAVLRTVARRMRRYGNSLNTPTGQRQPRDAQSVFPDGDGCMNVQNLTASTAGFLAARCLALAGTVLVDVAQQ